MKRPPFDTLPTTQPREEAVQATVRAATQAFRQREASRPLSQLEFLRQQAQFLHKRWWLLQGAVLVLLWWLLQSAGTAYEVQRAMGTLAGPARDVEKPVQRRLGNRVHRLLLPAANLRRPDGSVWSGGPGSAHPVLLRRPAGRAGHPAGPHHQFSAPVPGHRLYLSSHPVPPADTVCYAALPLCLAWTAVWVLLILSDQVYRMISLPMWLGMLLLATVYFLYAIRKLQNTCETIWEVSPVWH